MVPRLTTALISVALLQVWAHPKYVPYFPNGGRVPNVAAIGHADPDGGGDTNTFGDDYSLGGGSNAWSYANWTLCMKDSDGDGQSNGFELGVSRPCARGGGLAVTLLLCRCCVETIWV